MKKLNHKLAEAIKNDNLEEYISLRYPEIQEGEKILFENKNFSNVDFSQFGISFFCFKNCNLSGSTGFDNGVPVYLENCNCQNMDLLDQEVYFEAKKCDFRGLKINNKTSFCKTDNSIFENCQFDKNFNQELLKK